MSRSTSGVQDAFSLKCSRASPCSQERIVSNIFRALGLIHSEIIGASRRTSVLYHHRASGYSSRRRHPDHCQREREYSGLIVRQRLRTERPLRRCDLYNLYQSASVYHLARSFTAAIQLVRISRIICATNAYRRVPSYRLA